MLDALFRFSTSLAAAPLKDPRHRRILDP
jgi:hypothetical protein